MKSRQNRSWKKKERPGSKPIGFRSGISLEFQRVPLFRVKSYWYEFAAQIYWFHQFRPKKFTFEFENCISRTITQFNKLTPSDVDSVAERHRNTRAHKKSSRKWKSTEWTQEHWSRRLWPAISMTETNILDDPNHWLLSGLIRSIRCFYVNINNFRQLIGRLRFQKLLGHRQLVLDLISILMNQLLISQLELEISNLQ